MQTSDHIDHVALVPVSSIALIEKGNKALYSDSLSNIQRQIVINAAKHFRTSKIEDVVDINDDVVLKNRVENDVLLVADRAMRQKSLDSLSLPASVDSLVSASGQRYGMLIATKGFARTKKNYNSQIFSSIGIGIFTLGMFYTVPYRYSSDVYLMIVDADEDRVVFFRHLLQLDRNLLDEEEFVNQLQKMTEGYLVL